MRFGFYDIDWLPGSTKSVTESDSTKLVVEPNFKKSNKESTIVPKNIEEVNEFISEQALKLVQSNPDDNEIVSNIEVLWRKK